MSSCKSCQGDPAVKITPNGARMQFISGQPIMDQGFENAVQISLFTRKGWHGNAFLKKPSQKIGSDYELRCQEPINVDSINNIEDAAKNALQWLDDNRITKAVEIIVTNPKADMIKTAIKFQPNVNDITEMKFLSHAQNWEYQTTNPAHERFTEGA